MSVGRKRKTNNHLPRRVYLKHGAYYLLTPENQWIHLGKTEAEMHAAMAKRLGTPILLGTMADVFTRYRDEIIPTKASRTQVDNLAEIANLEKAFAHMKPATIKPVHIYAYLDHRGKTAKTRANREISLLSNVFSYCVRWGLIEHNPCKDVSKPTEKPRRRYVEDHEFATVHDLAPPIIQAAMEIAVLTGMRQGDILALTISQLREDGIFVEQAKTGKRQLFEWTPALRAAIDKAQSRQRQVAGTWYVIVTERGTRYTSNGFKAMWTRIMDKAVATGMERFTFHDLRAKAGSDHTNAQALLGHASPATTKRVYERKPTNVRPER